VQKPNNLPAVLTSKEEDLWEAKVRTETGGRGKKQEEIQKVKLQEDLKTTHDQSQLWLFSVCPIQSKTYFRIYNTIEHSVELQVDCHLVFSTLHFDTVDVWRMDTLNVVGFRSSYNLLLPFCC
jgi:hypothetical protein